MRCVRRVAEGVQDLADDGAKGARSLEEFMAELESRARSG